MKLPVRQLATFALGLLCLSSWFPALAGDSKQSPLSSKSQNAVAAPDMFVIPGPLRSFLRVAAISQEVSPDEVLPLVARNVSLWGYENGTPTEFLILLTRYVKYARELRDLAGADGVIHVNNCDDAERLIAVLGYRFTQTCGEKTTYLETLNPERAFLTLESGFPLTGLEEALQKQAPFSYPFPANSVPILFHETDWSGISSLKRSSNLLDVLLHDQNVDRLYWALSKSDDETRIALKRAPGLRALLAVAPAMDLYGSQLCIRSGRVVLPGGPGAAHSWQELAEASPSSSNFVIHLMQKDNGWLAAYFDALSRVSETQQQRLTQGRRLKLLYEAYRKSGGAASATRSTFPKNGDLLLLFTRLQWGANDQPYIPGNLAIWKKILSAHSSPEVVRGWVKHAASWDSPDQLLMSLVACSNFDADDGPLPTYLMLTAIDEARAPGIRLSDATVILVADTFSQFHSWDLIFVEFPALNDASIAGFVQSAKAVNGISSPSVRSNAMGAFQANIGLWEILARQQQISNNLNQSWQDVVQPFAAASSSIQVFDASRNSLKSLLIAATGEGNLSEDQIIELLAGPPQRSETGRRVHEELAKKMRSVLDDQRLVSLDTLFGLYDGLDEMAKGKTKGAQLIPLAGNLREFDMPRPIFTESEKITWSPQIYVNRHAELQVRTDLTKVIEAPGTPAQLEAARGQLTPFLRDTLVGLNYAYYEPPGAQALHHNPLLVRSHDFSGNSIQGYDDVWGPPTAVGIGATAGGGAYLIGSLADLPYALASMEEDFIAPENVQALIWQIEVPALLVSASQPRWWLVSPKELHASALYQSFGEELLTASSKNPELRDKVTDILSGAMTPNRLEKTEAALQQPVDTAALLQEITPAEKFYLAAEFRKRYPSQTASWGPEGRELDDLVRSDPTETSPTRLSNDFGIPHPTMAQTNACGILNEKPFPAYSGTSYRLLGESWESNNIYWARIADQMGYSPAMMNLLAPELTRHMVAKIAATDPEDWPALLRAMEQAGQDFQDGRITIATSIK